MPERLSAHLGSTPDAFQKHGVFDGFIDMDSQLHVDPHLFESSAIKEMRDARVAMDKYFDDVLVLVRAVNAQGGSVLLSQLEKKLHFPEYALSNLGFASPGSTGRGIGPVRATRIVEIARTVVRAGLDDPRIFELIGVFEEGIGADLISDMALYVCKKQFAEYTERMAAELNVDTRPFNIVGTRYKLPFTVLRGRWTYLLLYPCEVLRDLPVALDWDDVDYVSSYNDELRARLNSVIGQRWRDGMRRSKNEIRQLLLKNPDILAALVADYRTREENGYDFVKDRHGEVRWLTDAVHLLNTVPLSFTESEVLAFDDAVGVLLEYFRHVVEDQDAGILFRDRSELYAQRTFSCIAQVLCEKHDLDLAPETNRGRGPVDFKVSRGNQRSIIEFKLSSNRKLKHGYTKQLEVYGDAERAGRKFLVVLLVTESTKQVDDLLKLERQRQEQGHEWPKLVVIDAREKPPASKV